MDGVWRGRKPLEGLNRRHLSPSLAAAAAATAAVRPSVRPFARLAGSLHGCFVAKHRSGDSGPILPHITHPHTYVRTVGACIPTHGRSMGRAPPARGWSLGSKEQRPEINAKLEPDAKRQKKTHMLHSTMAATAFLVVRIRPTKLSFPNNRMKNAQRQATDNNATWCAFLAYLLTYAHWHWLSVNPILMTIGHL